MTGTELPELPVNPRPTIIFGLVIVICMLGGFTLWAILAPLAEAVVAGGVVKVDSSRKQIQHLEGGIVKDILVRDGDQVKKGQVLVRLDVTRAAASLAILRDGYDAALAQEARLLAERDDLSEIKFPEILLSRRDDANVSEILKSQNALWEARKSSLEGEVQIIKKQVVQLQDDIQGYQSQVKAKQKD